VLQVLQQLFQKMHVMKSSQSKPTPAHHSVFGVRAAWLCLPAAAVEICRQARSTCLFNSRYGARQHRSSDAACWRLEASSIAAAAAAV
jgi:Tfp pilus assembly protein PilV